MKALRGVHLSAIPGKCLNRLARTPIVPDETALKIQFKSNLGYPLDLDNPRTFNEKMQWLKLHNRNPLYTTLVDKYEVKKWVAERIGAEYVVPTLGVWDSFDEIDFGTLPERFVLKCTHDSGSVVVCRDKASFDVDAARKRLVRALRRNYFYIGREWPYKDVKPRILAEEYLEDAASGELPDYKFLCFAGRAKAMYMATERMKQGAGVKFDFFDMQFRHLPFTNGHPNSEHVLAKPERFEQMREYAEELSRDIPHVRVDFYEAGGQLYFGELTFMHMAGFAAFDPPEWDERFGSWLELPSGGGWLLVSDGWSLWLHEDVEEGSATQVSAPTPTDYKFYCFGGEARYVLACTGRGSDLRMDFFDRDWNHLPLTRGCPNAEEAPGAPAQLSRMRSAAERLAGGLPFVRADFYEVGGRCYFGEMTFHPAGGFGAFDPAEWDERLGRLIELPSGGGWLLMTADSALWLHAAGEGEAPAVQPRVQAPGLVDYKFFCFYGEPRFIYVSQGLEDHATARISFLNMDWTFAPFGRSDYEPFEELPAKPRGFGRMAELARSLSAGIPFVRVDFFEQRGEPLFSEMTFTPCGGFLPFDPQGWDGEIGDMLALPALGAC